MQGTVGTPADFKAKCVSTPFLQSSLLAHSPFSIITRLLCSTLCSLHWHPTFSLLPSSYKNPVITLDLTTKSRIIALFFKMSISEPPWPCFKTAGPMGSLVNIFVGALLGQPQTFVFSKTEKKGSFKLNEKSQNHFANQ